MRMFNLLYYRVACSLQELEIGPQAFSMCKSLYGEKLQ